MAFWVTFCVPPWVHFGGPAADLPIVSSKIMVVGARASPAQPAGGPLSREWAGEWDHSHGEWELV